MRNRRRWIGLRVAWRAVLCGLLMMVLCACGTEPESQPGDTSPSSDLEGESGELGDIEFDPVVSAGLMAIGGLSPAGGLMTSSSYEHFGGLTLAGSHLLASSARYELRGGFVATTEGGNP